MSRRGRRRNLRRLRARPSKPNAGALAKGGARRSLVRKRSPRAAMVTGLALLLGRDLGRGERRIGEERPRNVSIRFVKFGDFRLVKRPGRELPGAEPGKS